MPRRPNIDRPVALKLWLPETTRAKLDLILFSEAEQCVPRGAYAKFFLTLVNNYFANLKESRDVQP